MKKGFNILMILCAVLLILSCNNKNKSYTAMLKDERKVIERFIDAEGIDVLKNYPADGVFKENQFVKLSSGVYLNVIDSGNGRRATVGSTKILLRASGKMLLNDPIEFNGFDPLDGSANNVSWPIGIQYGGYTSIDDYYGYLFSTGLVSGLDYVGDSSVVKLIVPFRNGSTSQQKDGYPIYFDKVRYLFEK